MRVHRPHKKKSVKFSKLQESHKLRLTPLVILSYNTRSDKFDLHKKFDQKWGIIAEQSDVNVKALQFRKNQLSGAECIALGMSAGNLTIVNCKFKIVIIVFF